MMMRTAIVGCLLFTCATWVLPARAGSDDDRYTIMRPEPGTPGVVNKYKSPRGTRQRPAHLPDLPPPQQRIASPPPPIVIPQTGQVVPSLPPVPGGRAETFGDRATRCTHQAGVAGLPGDQRGAYMGSCLNQ